jgi:hypothetical protein
MKAKIVSEQNVFKPIVVNITIETKNEANELSLILDDTDLDVDDNIRKCLSNLAKEIQTQLK